MRASIAPFRLPVRDVHTLLLVSCDLPSCRIFSLSGSSFLFVPTFTKYEGRFVGVLRVKTRYRIGDASATAAVTSLSYRFPHSLPAFPLSKQHREEGCI